MEPARRGCQRFTDLSFSSGSRLDSRPAGFVAWKLSSGLMTPARRRSFGHDHFHWWPPFTDSFGIARGVAQRVLNRTRIRLPRVA